MIINCKGCSGKKKEDFATLARNLININQKTLTRDDLGGETEAVVLYKQARAIIQPKSGKETVRYENIDHTVSAEITIRYDANLANVYDISDYFIEYEGRVYDIKAILNLDTFTLSGGNANKIEGKRYQRLICIEGDI